MLMLSIKTIYLKSYIIIQKVRYRQHQKIIIHLLLYYTFLG